MSHQKCFTQKLNLLQSSPFICSSTRYKKVHNWIFHLSARLFYMEHTESHPSCITQPSLLFKEEYSLTCGYLIYWRTPVRHDPQMTSLLPVERVTLRPVRHHLLKVIITKNTREVLFLEMTGVYNCTWLPLCPYLCDIPGDCKVKDLCHQAANKWRRSGRECCQTPFRGVTLSGAIPSHMWIPDYRWTPVRHHPQSVACWTSHYKYVLCFIDNYRSYSYKSQVFIRLQTYSG